MVLQHIIVLYDANKCDAKPKLVNRLCECAINYFNSYHRTAIKKHKKNYLSLSFIVQSILTVKRDFLEPVCIFRIEINET